MSAKGTLHGLLTDAAQRCPENIAVEDPESGATITYGTLDARSDELSRLLGCAGVGSGDRVGLCGPKSIELVCALFSVLKADAAYVPVDPTAPLSRSAYIFKNCGVSAVVIHRQLLSGLCDEFSARELGDPQDVGADLCLLPVTGHTAEGESQFTVPGLAYILYTSGSTGRPKGVMHTHDSGLSFIDWCSEALQPDESERFSSHAPFHFDLSILDVFVPIKHMARSVLIGDELGKQPLRLAEVIAETKISVWYSTPSILRLLIEYGKLQKNDYSRLRLVLFAGEVFPLKHYQALKNVWSHPRYFNLYGPTETNVCTYYEVPESFSPNGSSSFPIGRQCSGDETRVVDEEGVNVPSGSEGELYVSGGSVMAGYWSLPEQNDAAFAIDENGARWYRTGDIVVDNGEGSYAFLGRRDRMVKRRGYRVELGEIEAVLYEHPSITEAAAVSKSDEESGVLVQAFISWSGSDTPSVVQLKQYCAQNLPRYMIPDRFSVLPDLPKTSTDKIDYQTLRALV